MSKLVRQLAMVAGAMALLSLAFAPAAFAGDYHTGSGLHCSDCHIMHASKDGTLINGGDGFSGLLKTGNVNGLCLSCHDGTDATAPDVIATGLGTNPPSFPALPATTDTLVNAYASPYKNSAGFFQSDWATQATIYAHNLGPSAVTAVQGTWVSDAGGMKCTDCHDPHGNINFRNMKLRPGGVGTDQLVAAATSGAQDVYLREDIVIPATAADTATHYDTDAVAFADGGAVVNWCISCHTNITSSSTTKHPQNVAVSGTEDGGLNWTTGGTSPGFGTSIDDTLSAGDRGIPRLRFAQGGTDHASSSTVAATNEVFCLSCHKAHGSRYDSTLQWPHFIRDANDRPAGCNQCHAKGT